jgi:hypothetical protein
MFESIDKQSGVNWGQIMLMFKVRTFVAKFRKKMYMRKALAEGREVRDRNWELMKYSKEEEFYVQQQAIGLQGELYIATNGVPKTEKNIEQFWMTGFEANFCSFERKFFYFGEGVILYKQREPVTMIDGRIYLAGIKDMYVYEKKKNEDLYLYFKIGLEIFTFLFKTERSLKKWAKSITFLKAKAAAGLMPVQFDEFSAIDKSMQNDELFFFRTPDYSYEGIKIAVEQARTKKEFDLKNMKVKDPALAHMEGAERSDDD